MLRCKTITMRAIVCMVMSPTFFKNELSSVQDISEKVRIFSSRVLFGEVGTLQYGLMLGAHLY